MKNKKIISQLKGIDTNEKKKLIKKIKAHNKQLNKKRKNNN
ncbi:MAG: hypothetical protein ACK50A_06930 [Sphingobacteriaceae bacterium]|jgi:hypothetical protein